MKTVHIFKANPLYAKDPDGVTIVIREELPQPMDSKELDLVFEKEAQIIYGALRQSIPSGTMHRLLIELLKHHENLYRGVR